MEVSSTKTTTYETTPPRERAYLVGTEIRGATSPLTAEESLDELVRLADTAGIDVVGQTIQRFDKPNVATYIGPGEGGRGPVACGGVGG